MCEVMKKKPVWNNPITMPDVEPPHLEQMGDYVFKRVGGGVEVVHCSRVGTKLYMPERLNARPIHALGMGALSGCEQLRSIVLPRTLYRIGDFAFFQCENLEEVRVAEDLEEVGARAFAGCTRLRTLYLPPTVEAIDESAFEGLVDLTLSGAKNSFAHRFARAHGMPFLIVRSSHAA